MATTTLAPPPPGARHRLWTAVEFDHMGDFGLFEGRRAILMDGVILEWGQMDPPHAITLYLTLEALRPLFGSGWLVRSQMPIHLADDTNPMPDVAILPGHPRDFQDGHPTTATFVVEVSDTSLDYDQTVKAEKYAAAAIPEYWVVDVEGRRLLVFRDPYPHPAGGHAYRNHLTLGPADAVAPLAAPHASVRVADLLP